MVGSLGCQNACLCRAGTGDLRGAGDLPTRAHAENSASSVCIRMPKNAQNCTPPPGAHFAPALAWEVISAAEYERKSELDGFDRECAQNSSVRCGPSVG